MEGQNKRGEDRFQAMIGENQDLSGEIRAAMHSEGQKRKKARFQMIGENQDISSEIRAVMHSPASWQSSFISTSKAISSLKNSQKMSDAILLVEGEKIPVHSFLLSIRSEFFETLFASRWTDQDVVDHKRIIKIDSPVTKAGIDSLLSHIYDEKEELIGTNILDTWIAATFFQVDSLKQKCHKFMSEQICFRNCLYFIDAISYSGPEKESEKLLQLLLRFVDQHADEVFSDLENFKDILPETFNFILSRDSLCISSESSCLKALTQYVAWQIGDNASILKKRKFLEKNKLVWSIRYKFLEEKELFSIPYLTDSELVSIQRSKLGIIPMPEEIKDVSPSQPLGLDRRVGLSGIVHEIIRLPSEDKYFRCIHAGDETDMVEVSFNKEVIMRGISTSGPTEYGIADFHLVLYDQSSKILAENSSANVECEPRKEVKLLFSNPPKLQRWSWYCIELRIKSHSSIPFFSFMDGKPKQLVHLKKFSDPLEICWRDVSGASIRDISKRTSVFKGQIPSIHVSVASL